MRDYRTGAMVGAFFLVLISLCIYALYESVRTRESLLTVTFIDVGQGDATFIESPTGMEVLIDGGRNEKVLEALPTLMGYFDRSLDLMIATHPDADHIGGLISVLERFAVQRIIISDNVNDTPAYEAFMRAVDAEGAEVLYVERGHTFDLGVGRSGSTTLTVLFPDREARDLESNLSSLILKLSYGDADFLFTGDSPQSIERYLISLDGSFLESEVLKIGHHGSRTSSDPAFVSLVRPAIGVVSAGKDNRYGHPHKEVLETLSTASVITKNTANEGSIFLQTDGKTIWLQD